MPPIEDFNQLYDLISLFTNQQRTVNQDQETNHLAPHKFRMVMDSYINKEVSYHVQAVAIPDVSINIAEVSYPLVGPVKEAGDQITFAGLDVSFIVDQYLLNYREIFQWIVGLATIKDNRREITKTRDVILQSLDPQNNLTSEIVFKDAFPTSLSSIPYDVSATDSEYFLASVSFEYLYFVIK